MKSKFTYHLIDGEKVSVSTHSYSTFCTLKISMGLEEDQVVFFFPLKLFSHMEKVAEVWNNPKVETYDPSP